MPATECPFCEPDAAILLADTGLVRIVADRFPLNPGHCLVTPVRHFARWDEARPEEKHALLEAIDRALEIARAHHPTDAFNVGWNDGPAAGQTIGHFHIHVVPRVTGDVPDPRGGIRWMIPERAAYWREPQLPAGTDLLGAPHAEGLVTGDDDPLLPHLASCFARAERVDIAVAFVMRRGVELLRPHLLDLLDYRCPPGGLRLLTGDYLGATDPDGLELLLDLPGEATLRVFEAADQAFHPKSYIFHFADGCGIAFVGSSNLSKSALQNGVEWNYRIVRSQDRDGFASVVSGFERLFAHTATRSLTQDWITRYRKTRLHSSPQVATIEQDPSLEDVHPHAIQVAALKALEATREDGNTAGLVVLATGLGKTWLAAFDSEPFARVLFVAHREEILDQAINTFRRIRPTAALGKYTGTDKAPDADILFASVQTLARAAHLRSFPADHFDYVVIDEFHHASASTYRRLIDHFEPRFLLGLTATPDRTDGADLLALCGHNLVHRADLGQGIEQGLLSPFHYQGVPDDVDYAQIPWRTKRETEELTRLLATRKRAANALENFERYAGTRALGFCCSQAHADFMAQWFNDHGKRAAAVHSGESSAPRTLTLQALARGNLDIVFSVDMFNEGIDVPTIDTVLMLRPTQSRIVWLQQLGRGLRKAESKERLQVIDYIGNHRVFLNKPLALLGALFDPLFDRGEGDDVLRTALRQLKDGTLELPPGCAVTYDLVETLIDELLQPTTGAARLRTSYTDFRERHGRRPTPAELHGSGSLPKTTMRKEFTSWFGMVRAMGDLTEAEAQVIDQCEPFLQELETTAMDKSFKMLTLEALISAGALPGSLTIQELARRFQRIADRSPLLRTEVTTSTAKFPTLEAMLKANPVKAWTRGRFFRLEQDQLSSTFEIAPGLRDTATAMITELVDWRLSEYHARRNTRSFECAVFSNQRHPILKLPDRGSFPDLPQGAVDLWAEGTRFEAHFAKMAINRIHRPEDSSNALPELLRGWFGPDAGKPGRAESVAFEMHEGGYRVRPLRMQLSDTLQVHDDQGQPLDATFRVERAGDHVWVVFFSRGGTKGSSKARNVDYQQGLEVLLVRMASLQLVLEQAQLDSRGAVNDLSTEDRRLDIDGNPFPIDLAGHPDLQGLRKQLGKAQAAVGRPADAKGAGNSTRQIRLQLSLPPDLHPEDLPARLARP